MLTLTLPKQFFKDLEDVIEDELKIAQKKWQLKLTEEEKDVVRKNAYTQVYQKASTVAGSTWAGEKHIIVKIPYFKDVDLKLNANTSKTLEKDLELVMTKDGWITASDESESPVLLSQIINYKTNIMLVWARTAVFYGVGSYK